MNKTTRKADVLRIESARIGFRNFAGKGGEYNVEGARNFCVFLSPEDGEQLKEIGWNIKWAKANDDGERQAYLQVAVKFGNIPPAIHFINSKGRRLLDEDEVNMLDWAEYLNIDMVINPSHWSKNGNSGIKAYLKSMFFTVYEDEFEKKYTGVPVTTSGDL